jgi:hypothetical protein
MCTAVRHFVGKLTQSGRQSCLSSSDAYIVDRGKIHGNFFSFLKFNTKIILFSQIKLFEENIEMFYKQASC